MSRNDYVAGREELRVRRKAIVAEIQSHRDTLLSELSLLHEADELNGEYIAVLGVKVSELEQELRGVDRKIAVLTRELGG